MYAASRMPQLSFIMVRCGDVVAPSCVVDGRISDIIERAPEKAGPGRLIRLKHDPEGAVYEWVRDNADGSPGDPWTPDNVG